MSYKKSQGEEVFNFLGTYKELHQMPLFTTTKFITAISKNSEPLPSKNISGITFAM